MEHGQYRAQERQGGDCPSRPDYPLARPRDPTKKTAQAPGCVFQRSWTPVHRDGGRRFSVFAALEKNMPPVVFALVGSF
jgi:hypothetical protein